MAENAYDWIPFYTELADRLRSYRERRGELIRIIYEMYTAIDIPTPTLDSQTPAADIDPFTVFGLFNKGITPENRIRIATALAERLGVREPVPKSFDGVPILLNLNATFYRFSNDPDRSADDIDALWTLLFAALAYADRPGEAARADFISAYNSVMTRKGIGWRHTIGLFWVRPFRYLNLDSRNRWYLLESKYMTLREPEVFGDLSLPPDGEHYDRICSALLRELELGDHAFKTIPEFSSEAWTVSERVNADTKAREDAGDAAPPQPSSTGRRYWYCAPGEGADSWEQFQKQGIIAIGWNYDNVGNLMQYDSKKEMQKLLEAHGAGSSPNTLALWCFSHEMKPGDVIYAKRGTDTILGRGIVNSPYLFKETSVIPGNPDFRNVRQIDWTPCKEWKPSKAIHQKTLTEITDENVIKELEAHFTLSSKLPKAEAPAVSDASAPEPYTTGDFLNEVYMEESDYRTLARLLRKKRNVILQGPPGVGKTFAAERLAWSILRAKDPDRVCMVQFHQNYSYEDFLMGWRPSKDGFVLRHGPFWEFCRKAEDDPTHDYFFVIDEINRGNLSKIFGELLMLIESDKRGKRVKLLYGDDDNDTFAVPKNVFLIGMMNTADRSIAIIDYALRRRFAFFDMKPGFSTRGFTNYLESMKSGRLTSLVKCVKDLNEQIRADATLGAGFEIGHSYFCRLEGEGPEAISGIVEYELIPLLREYWYDDDDSLVRWTEALRAAVR